jgi:hypothetical protein
MTKELSDPRQLLLFPELSRESNIDSITTLPDFDKALNNLIKISDLGAFIQLNISGLERGYSLKINEMVIPNDFIKDGAPRVIHFQLFPDEIRNQLKKYSYEIKSFFNSKNSFHTEYGYFLYRSHFSMWKHYIEQMKKNLNDFLYSVCKGNKYGKMFLNTFQNGYDFLFNLADIIAPWEKRGSIYLKDIESVRSSLKTSQKSGFQTPTTDIDFPFQLMVAKTEHIPITISAFVSCVNISSIFKIIHLEYLVDKSIRGIDDIKKLVKSI